MSANPVIILAPCSNSHPFEERRIFLSRSEEQAVKVGRSIVRLQPTHDNAIFDCKVLSRNHAIMWVDGDGRFLIKDTKSSNGTFVNNERLSNSGEDSTPKELFSGDILQLGVEIVDNAKKVASGCVICMIRLFDENGEEHLRNDQAVSVGPSYHMQLPLHPNPGMEQYLQLAKYTLVRNDKLFMMGQYVKEARHREAMLEQKLKLLEEQCYLAQEALDTSWHSMVNEEQLLSRIEMLNSQLAILTSKYNGQLGEDKFRKELLILQEDRANAETLSKDSLRKAEEQLSESQMCVHDTMNRLINQEEENTLLQQKCQEFENEYFKLQTEYSNIVERYNEVLKEQNQLKKKLEEEVQMNKNIAKDNLLEVSVQTEENFPDLENKIIIFENNASHEAHSLSNGFPPNKKESFPLTTSDDKWVLQWIQENLINPSDGRTNEKTLQEIKKLINSHEERQRTEVPPEKSSNGHPDSLKEKSVETEGIVLTNETVKQNFLPAQQTVSNGDEDFQICLLTTFPMFFLIYVLLRIISYSFTSLQRTICNKKGNKNE